MRTRSLDGKQDVTEMLVPIPPNTNGMVLIRGDGVPTKIGVGAPDLPAETWLDITNRFVDGAPYTSIERVCIGVVALADEIRQGRDVIAMRGGTTFGTGTMPADKVDEPGSMLDATEEFLDTPTAVWLITDDAGKKYLGAFPNDADSFELRDMLVPMMKGEFSLDRVDSGTFSAAPDLAPAGWTIMMDRRPEPDAAPAP